MAFVIEVDRLKNIFRQSYIIDGSRKENDAEHSWHLAIMAFILSEYANRVIDVLKVIKMVIIHDLVEIDAGDTYAYDTKGHEHKFEKELVAAKRIFGLLPEDLEKEMLSLWDEFEEGVTPEAQFALALDKVQPVILNYLSEGKAWIQHGIYKEQVVLRNKGSKDGAEALWEYVMQIIDEATEKGYLKTGKL